MASRLSERTNRTEIALAGSPDPAGSPNPALERAKWVPLNRFWPTWGLNGNRRLHAIQAEHLFLSDKLLENAMLAA